MAAEFKTRTPDVKLLSVEQSEGRGARVRRSIGRPELRHFDPFLMLDEFKAEAGSGAGFPDHPHRGFETVSYLLEGGFEHEDFAGHRGSMKAGDVQWMTAGKGIMHSEIPNPDLRNHGLQLWVNLAGKDKMMEPRYQELKKEDIPEVTRDGVKVVIIAGESFDTKSPVYTITPTMYLHFTMEKNKRLEQKIPETMNAFLYTIRGKIRVGGEQAAVDAHHTITLTAGKGKDGILVETDDDEGEFVLVAGEPHGEPIVQYGPFVMNTQEEIGQAFSDFRSGKNGFERAKHWRSELGSKYM